MYCDRTAPHTWNLETSDLWYRDDFTRRASFLDTQHAWRIEAQQRDRAPPLQSYSSYFVVGTSSAGTTSFSRNVLISVGIGSCANTGSDGREVRVRFSDYWLNDLTLSNTYDIDLIDPRSSHSFPDDPVRYRDLRLLLAVTGMRIV
jgi:hypothetical protein